MLQVFFFEQILVEMIRFKITIYLVIKQNIFEFSSESRVHENEHSAGKSPVCFLVYRDKVRHQTKVSLCLKVLYSTLLLGWTLLSLLNSKIFCLLTK